jgi:hypothetical protein
VSQPISTEQIRQRSLIDYVIDRIEAEQEAVEVLDSGEVVITINDEARYASRAARWRQHSPSRSCRR